MNTLEVKNAYLKQLSSRMWTKSVELGKELDGSTPPSVFIGSWNYPKVFAGPMFVPQHGDTSFVDSPESWIPGNVGQQEIINFRMSLIRGKKLVVIRDLDNELVEKMREISMASTSVESEAQFAHKPVGRSFTDEHTPYGPTALLERFEIGNCRWDLDLEKVYYDTDLRAQDAIVQLYEKNVPFSRIQKAFSVGTMGVGKNRRLVPTRWSITACDSTLGRVLLDEVRQFDVIDNYQVREFSSLNNYYAVILTPTLWQYEWTEAFLHVMGNEEMVFSDYERNSGKRGYSTVGGCYYSCKFAVLEALARMRKQAGALVLREAYRGYVPLGVFNVRENVRSAMRQPAKEFENIRGVLDYLSTKMKLPMPRFIEVSTLLKEELRGRQMKLTSRVSNGQV